MKRAGTPASVARASMRLIADPRWPAMPAEAGPIGITIYVHMGTCALYFSNNTRWCYVALPGPVPHVPRPRACMCECRQHGEIEGPQLPTPSTSCRGGTSRSLSNSHGLSVRTFPGKPRAPGSRPSTARGCTPDSEMTRDTRKHQKTKPGRASSILMARKRPRHAARQIKWACLGHCHFIMQFKRICHGAIE